jgi:dUTP pyrophosphatase
MIPVSIRRLDPTIPLPEYQSPGAAGFDLAAGRDIDVAPNTIALVPTGLVIRAPEGHFLGIFARSSTPLKHGLMVANGVGVVDPDYAGEHDEVKIAVLNVRASAVTVAPGERIAQGIVLPAPRVQFEEAAAVAESRGGFGSTGS